MSKADPKSRWTSMFPPSRGLEELSRRRLKPEADSWSFPVKITPRWKFLIYNYCNGSEFMVTHPQIKALTLRPDVVNPVNLRDVFHATHLLKASESHWGYFCCWFSTLHFMAFESPNIHLLGSTKNVCDHKPDGQSYPHSLVSSHTHTHAHKAICIHTHIYIYIYKQSQTIKWYGSSFHSEPRPTWAPSWTYLYNPEPPSLWITVKSPIWCWWHDPRTTHQ